MRDAILVPLVDQHAIYRLQGLSRRACKLESIAISIEPATSKEIGEPPNATAARTSRLLRVAAVFSADDLQTPARRSLRASVGSASKILHITGLWFGPRRRSHRIRLVAVPAHLLVSPVSPAGRHGSHSSAAEGVPGRRCVPLLRHARIAASRPRLRSGSCRSGYAGRITRQLGLCGSQERTRRLSEVRPVPVAIGRNSSLYRS